jgi:nucleotide-binding universal stress UspA family protein
MYKTILHATDLAENHFYMCEQANKLAKSLNANLYILHVIEPPASLQIAQGLGFTEIYNPAEAKKNATEVLAIIGESLNLSPNQQFVEIGSIKQHVLGKISELDCGLVILGRQTPNNIPEFLESTAHLVMKDSPCDVLTINACE